MIADHVRTTTFLIADGVTPSNEWRGYVLRRIMRRAMRHGKMLGLAEPFLWRGVAWVVSVMGEAYPEIVSERARIEAVVRGEEERFAETLDNGLRRIEEYAAAQGEGQGRTIDGRFLFTLYDTFGFPRDLAEDELRDRDSQRARADPGHGGGGGRAPACARGHRRRGGRDDSRSDARLRRVRRPDR